MRFFDDLSFILSIFIKSDEFAGATNHPIHIHGHHVHILKVSYPEVDEETGIIVKATPDIRCAGKDCKYPSWEKEEWAGGNVPDLNLRNPPLKDTVVVPRMGYVVLRFPLDNPGIWKIVKRDKILNVVRIIYYAEILSCFATFCKVLVAILWVYLSPLEEKLSVCINLYKKSK